MHTAIIISGDLGTQLFNGIFSWQFLQFIVALLSYFGFVLTSAVILILAERKIMGWMQDRVGPIHTGPWGLLQTVADVGKLLMKEDIHASATDKLVFLLAPSVFLAPVIAAFAVIPFSPYVNLPGTALATGIIYYVAMSSIDVVGVVMAGWGSNNKYALIGGLRSAAQMISYELPLVLALVSVIMLTSVLAGTDNYPGQPGIGTVSVGEIIRFQMAGDWPGKGIGFFDFIFKGFTPWAWFFLVQPYLGEYGNMTIVSSIATALFLGGWSGPGVGYLTGLGSPGWGLLGNLLGIAYFISKVYLLSAVFIWVRSTLPRLRADQLMQFAWLILIPTTLGNILLTGAIYLILNALGASNIIFLVVLGVINWFLLFGFVWVVRRATLVTTRRAQAPAIRAQRRAGTAAQLPDRATVASGGRQ